MLTVLGWVMPIPCLLPLAANCREFGSWLFMRSSDVLQWLNSTRQTIFLQKGRLVYASWCVFTVHQNWRCGAYHSLAKLKWPWNIIFWIGLGPSGNHEKTTRGLWEGFQISFRTGQEGRIKCVRRERGYPETDEWQRVSYPHNFGACLLPLSPVVLN